MTVLGRRGFLRLSTAALAPWRASRPPVPRVNGGINISPLRRFETDAGFTPPIIVPRLVELQMRILYELGFEQVRITIAFEGFGPNFFAAIPYVRAARALGMDVVGVLADFEGFGLVRALSDPATRDEVLETYARVFGDFVPAAAPGIEPGRFDAQILNEPTFFTGISPTRYVRDFLRPAYLHLKEDDPTIRIVSAAPVSSADGFLRAQLMIDAGVEDVCDRIAFHLYSTRFADRLARLTNRPIWVTESGAQGTERHFDWRTSTFDEIRRRMPRVFRIFWFDLFDFAPNAFRLYDIVRDPLAEFVAVPESTRLVDWFRGRAREAASGTEPAAFEELVPDIVLYFPTEEDRRIVAATSFGLQEGL